ncbi:olfactory receptor 2K2-like [Latimeria chalumnae]|uniref:olfactory receptor 2K2-like n=1 Tax=Latimeria chalumnae TaxID=7897 RepID=UPI0006D8F949|nr:PREDICTED: olfactory receptor 13F1-like [Latimeria chalumnae]|eukprot:XP_014351427.1 PREDICTED: olfactory receptor 13F1-like [Latimeria chalumnae]
MEGIQNISIFTLSGFVKMDTIAYLFFSCTLLLFLATVFVNIVLIAVIILEQSLHEPMYICLCNLSVNELVGSYSLLPHLMASLLSETKTISYIGCFFQVFCLHTYGTVELLILSVMAYDRYIAICNPLRYSTIMTKTKASKLLVFAWLYSSSYILIVITLSLRLSLCGSTIEKLYCDNVSIMKLSCVEPSFNNIFGLVMLVINVGVPVIVIMYSYIQILKVCLKISKEARAKAFHTCCTHLLTFFSFVTGALFVIIGNRVNSKTVPGFACDYDHVSDDLICDNIVEGIQDNSVRHRLLKESEVNLARAMEICRAAEACEAQMKSFEAQPQISNWYKL